MDAFPCRSLRRSRRASRQSSATRSVSEPGLMVARSSRLGRSGSRSPGRRYESSRHGLAASRPRTPGSGAVRFHSPPTKPSSRFGTRHIVRCNAVVRSAPLPVRHPGPRVTAAGCYTPAPSGLATTASQSGQRHASYHPPRLIMSPARHKMLSTLAAQGFAPPVTTGFLLGLSSPAMRSRRRAKAPVVTGALESRGPTGKPAQYLQSAALDCHQSSPPYFLALMTGDSQTRFGRHSPETIPCSNPSPCCPRTRPVESRGPLPT